MGYFWRRLVCRLRGHDWMELVTKRREKVGLGLMVGAHHVRCCRRCRRLALIDGVVVVDPVTLLPDLKRPLLPKGGSGTAPPKSGQPGAKPG